MIPILHAPGVMMPGQLGPMRRLPLGSVSSTRRTLIMSITGMPSVMHTTSEQPASKASRMASAAPGGGTKMQLVSAPVSFTAWATVLNTGTLPSNFSPPRPGVQPETTFVPYSSICLAWNEPAPPVIP